jgi:carotenoid cleavage dioxygenase-like enzyme
MLITSACPTGQIPKWLRGTFLRLGPGKFDIGDFVVNHWFDGYAVLCKFDIQNGKVSLFLHVLIQFLLKTSGVDAFQHISTCVMFVISDVGGWTAVSPCWSDKKG